MGKDKENIHAADDSSPMGDNNSCSRDTSLYGGQAVLEGVMIKGRKKAVVACRNPKGEIVSKVLLDDSDGKSAKGIRRIPFFRGFFILVDSLSLGIKALNFSAEVAMPAEQDSRRDKSVEKNSQD